MTARSYDSPEAFKQALEQRFRFATGSGTDFGRRRQLLVFDRFLARVAAVFGDAITLKGGLVLEIRLRRARTTKDIDLRFTGSPGTVLERLQEAGRRDLGDFMTYEVSPDEGHTDIQNQGMLYGGRRFRAECRLAGKIYGQRFGVDVGIADPIVGSPDLVVAQDVLGFAGIAPPKIRLYPIESHVAEKLHAYTLPRPRPNSRIKDLPDLALLASAGPLAAGRLRAALEQTFGFRNTHPVPAVFPAPLPTWAQAYAAMAREDSLPWPTLADATAAVERFLNPVLAGATDGKWDPATWKWK
jgi:hypothetical protein